MDVGDIDVDWNCRLRECRICKWKTEYTFLFSLIILGENDGK